MGVYVWHNQLRMTIVTLPYEGATIYMCHLYSLH